MSELEKKFNRILKIFNDIVVKACEKTFDVSRASIEYYYYKILENNGVLTSSRTHLGMCRFTLHEDFVDACTVDEKQHVS